MRNQVVDSTSAGALLQQYILELGGDLRELVVKTHPYDNNIHVHYKSEMAVIDPWDVDLTTEHLYNIASQLCWKPAPFTKRSKRKGWQSRRSPVKRFWV